MAERRYPVLAARRLQPGERARLRPITRLCHAADRAHVDVNLVVRIETQEVRPQALDVRLRRRALGRILAVVEKAPRLRA